MPEDIYIPSKKGKRVAMPGGLSDWPEDGRPVNFASPYESRLVTDGTLKKKPADQVGGAPEGSGAGKRKKVADAAETEGEK